MNPARRRRVLGGLASGRVALAAGVSTGWSSLFNGCRASPPQAIADGERIRSAWAGIDPARFVDCHVHLASSGDPGSGIGVNPQMESLLQPLQYAQRLFYLNAGCVPDAPGRVDDAHVERMRNLVAGLKPGVKLLLFAFDRFHDVSGRPDRQSSSFHTPNAHARQVAARHPEQFCRAVSIPPYRGECLEELARAIDAGAKSIKGLPPAMGIDPSSPSCDRHDAALDADDLPRISHAGDEKAVHGADLQALRSPPMLHRALDHGACVVVAHCAWLGGPSTSTRGADGPMIPCFEVVRQHNPLLFAFVLKRQLSSGGYRFAPAIFETSAFIERRTA